MNASAKSSSYVNFGHVVSAIADPLAHSFQADNRRVDIKKLDANLKLKMLRRRQNLCQ